MVVADNKINPYTPGILHLIHRFDTAVEGDDERATFLFGGVDTLGGDTVSFGVPVGDVIDDIIRLGLEEGVHQRHGRCSVHIIVAVHHDPFVRIDSATETIHGGTHIAHQEGVVQTVQRRTDVCPCFGGRTDSASRQDTSRYRTDLQFGTQTFCGTLLFRR